MAATNSPRGSQKNSSGDSELGPGLTQEELSSNGSSWRQKFTANAYGSHSESSRPKRRGRKPRTVTSVAPPSADSEKAE